MTQSLRILILEDNPLHAEMVQFELEEAGLVFTARVVTAEEDYVRGLQEFSPDLILSDYDLPQYNGVSALAEAKIRHPDIPFILVTGAVGEDRAIEVLTQGAKDYVLKSRLHRLVPAVRRAIAEAQEQRARSEAEAALHEAHRTLEERVKIRTAELEAEIAAHKKTEEALFESRARYRELVVNANSLILRVDQNGTITFFNEYAQEFFGYTLNEILGKNVRILFPPPGSNGKGLSGTEDNIFRNRDEFKDNIIKNIRKNGERRWVSWRCKALKDASGTIIGNMAIGSDITERKRATKALKDSEQSARRMVQETEVIAEIGRIISSTLNVEEVYERFAEKVREAIPFDRITVNTVNLKDSTRTIRYVKGDGFWGERSGEVVSLAGTRTEHVMRTKSSLLVNSKNREDVIRKFPRMASRGSEAQSMMTVPLISKGEVFGVLGIQSAKMDAYSENDLLLAERMGSQIAGAIANAQLFLELKQAEETLRESEKVARRLAQESELIAEIGRIVSSTLNIEEVFERFAEKVREVIPFDRIGVSAVNMKDYTRTMMYVKGDRFPGESSKEAISLAGSGTEHVMRTKSSLLVNSKNREDMRKMLPSLLSFRFLDVRSLMMVPLISKDEVIGALAIHSVKEDAYSENDLFLAERMGSQIAGAIANAQLYLAHKQTEEGLAKQAIFRQEQTAQLEAANKELESFSYSVSHDLRAPLLAIDSFSKKLIQDMKDKLGDEEKHKLDVIRNSAQRMNRLIDDLLAFSRLGRQATSASVVNMQALVNQVWEDCRDAAASRKIELQIGELPPAFCDRGLMRQVFTNLLSNAIKFTRLRDDAVIEIGGSKEEKRNIYHIKDNGVGFDMQYSDKLFGVFQRLHRADEFEGTGIGLALVQRIIHRHGGEVWAEAKANEGATFYFTLPSSH